MKKFKSNKRIRFYFFALGVTGVGISGGDRIFVELARNWSKKNRITIYTSFEGKRLCSVQNLEGKNLEIISVKNRSIEKLFFINYLYKVFAGISLGLTLKLGKVEGTFLYPASDFWMDFFPAVLVKIRYPKAKLIATWYQTAPNPFKGYAEGSREKVHRFKAFLYWFSQLPVKPLINRFADKIIVNNEDEKKRFPEHTKRDETIVLIGAVDLKRVKEWKRKRVKVKKIYDCVFQGRFHPQKGVVELIDIWKKVVDKKPDAKLAMIGDGPLMKDVRFKIKDSGLKNNVKLFGYVFDGPKKYSIFSSSKIVAHPAFYDSGGMASAEAMAFGLPAVGFNLKAYESYYPVGMLKVETGDIDAFANAIVKLLDARKYRKGLAKKALEMIEKNWSWDKRAKDVFEAVADK